jgi:hypothetical protein
MTRLLAALALAALSAASTHAQLPGTGVLQARSKLAIPHCRKAAPERSSFTLTVGVGVWDVLLADGTTMQGTCTASANGRRARCAFDDATTAALLADLTSQIGERCRVGVTVTSARTKQFLVRWNRARTRVKLAIVEVIAGHSDEVRGHATFRLNAAGPWTTNG